MSDAPAPPRAAALPPPAGAIAAQRGPLALARPPQHAPSPARWRAAALLKPLALLCWLLGAAPSHAVCDSGLAGRMSAKLHPDRVLDEERAACKSWPGVLGRSIVVLPLPRPITASGATEFDLDLLIVQQADNGNTDRSTITSRRFEPRALTEGHGRIDDIRIDTSRYPLAANVRAFGVRVRTRGVSRVHPSAEETLTLYVPQGARLDKVLDATEVSMDRGEWEGECVGSFEQMRGTVSAAASSSHGWADLLLQRTRSSSRASFIDGDCTEQPQGTRIDSERLRFDGQRYVPALQPHEASTRK